MNYQGRIGVYFNILKLSGTVTLNGSGVSGAIVRLIRQSTDTEIGKTTTNGSGYYEFSGYANQIITGELYHVTVEYTDGGAVKYNAKSQWAVVPATTP